MKKWVSLVGISLLLVGCVAEAEQVKSEESIAETTNEATNKTEVSSHSKGSDETAVNQKASGELTWDEQILSEDGKAALLSGSILGTSLEIGSTLTEVEAELGLPDKEDYFAGAPLKKYGDIHISHLTNEDTVVAFFLSLHDSISIDELHELWGEPTSISPMEIDDIIEVHQYIQDGFVATFELTLNAPDTINKVHISKQQ